MILSLHHVTATVAEASPDVDFYTRILGLRLVKRTVNFDNHGVYHFYYGDEAGRPSTLMTTFPYAGQGVRSGTKGAGQITVTSFSVPPGSLDFWRERLEGEGIGVSENSDRFGSGALMVEDPSGLNIELVEGPDDGRDPWVIDGVDPGVAIRGIHGVTFVVRSGERSIRFLEEVLGWRVLDRAGSRARLGVGNEGPGSVIEVLESAHAPDGVNGLGTVHHVAMAVAGNEEQLAFREKLVGLGHQVTPVRDRQYFRSIYFREPGGILYEIATEGPGFLIDEDPETLGTALKLPAWEEENRPAIESALPEIRLSDTKG
jgi:glyoxalase family protein